MGFIGYLTRITIRVMRIRIDEPLPVVAKLTVKMGENEAILELSQGESVEEAVRKFCAVQGIDLAENGPMLERALANRVQQASEQVEQDDDGKKEKAFLFSIPVSINGTEVRLSVHEGDRLEPLVTGFCGKQIQILVWILLVLLN